MYKWVAQQSPINSSLSRYSCVPLCIRTGTRTRDASEKQGQEGQTGSYFEWWKLHPKVCRYGFMFPLVCLPYSLGIFASDRGWGITCQVLLFQPLRAILRRVTALPTRSLTVSFYSLCFSYICTAMVMFILYAAPTKQYYVLFQLRYRATSRVWSKRDSKIGVGAVALLNSKKYCTRVP